METVHKYFGFNAIAFKGISLPQAMGRTEPVAVRAVAILLQRYKTHQSAVVVYWARVKCYVRI